MIMESPVRASATRARRAYFAFCEITLGNPFRISIYLIE
jgi:hypothetical protein